MIARQRFMLNRTTRTANLPAAERPNRQTAGQWADFRKTSARVAKLAETLERLLGKPFPMLFDAEKEMLAAGGELSEGRFPPAVPHDKDALTNLIKARNTVRLALAVPPPGCKESRSSIASRRKNSPAAQGDGRKEGGRKTSRSAPRIGQAGRIPSTPRSRTRFR